MKNKTRLQRINVSVAFAVFTACLMVTDTTGLAAYALLCAAVHEIGHLAAIRRFHAPVEEISVRLFGINIRLRNNVTLGYRQELVVALAGCAANLLLCLAAWLLMLLKLFEAQSFTILLFSLLIGAFNLLPIGVLDGGRALEAALCLRLPPESAHHAVTVVSVILLLPLAVAGFYVLLRTGFNFTLLLVAGYLAVMLILNGGKKETRVYW